MSFRTLLASVLLLLLPACSDSLLPVSAGDTVVRAGTSFGFCEGYCSTELRIDQDEIVLTETSRDAARYPARVHRVPIEAAESQELLALVDTGTLRGLNDVYGCPDCADGGAEWVEVESGGFHKRVTFEYGSEVGPIQPLIDRLRAIRQRF